MSHQTEPFAMADFEIHRVVAEPSGNPFLRAIERGDSEAAAARMAALTR